MLARAIALAVPLAFWAGPAASAEQPASPQETEQQKPENRMGDSVSGHGHSAGALGNSSDTTGAKGKGGAGTNTGRKGSKQQTAAGEGGTGSAQMDPSGATTPSEKAAAQKKTKAKAKPKAKPATKPQGETKAEGEKPADPQGATTQ